MRRFLIAGNWKMNLRHDSSIALAKAIAACESARVDVEMLICPTFVYLGAVAQVVSGSKVGLGAQDVNASDDGAFTGEISVEMLVDVGCRYVILGHSERRTLMGETNEMVNSKLLASLTIGLTPILCVGESLEERETGKTLAVISKQIENSLAGLTAVQVEKIVIAYEPVWAIGTGKVASPEQAQQVHADLRKLVETRYNSNLAEQVRILYGGSVKPDNAGDLMSQPDIDGALVGGASLKADSFLAIAAACPVR